MQHIIGFLVSVVAGIASHYICKWLDWHSKGPVSTPQAMTPREQPSPWGSPFVSICNADRLLSCIYYSIVPPAYARAVFRSCTINRSVRITEKIFLCVKIRLRQLLA